MVTAAPIAEDIKILGGNMLILVVALLALTLGMNAKVLNRTYNSRPVVLSFIGFKFRG